MYRIILVCLFIVSTKSLHANYSLSEVVDLALENNYEYKASVEAYNANYALSGIARAHLIPKVTAQGTLANQSTDMTTEGITQSTSGPLMAVTLRAAQPLFHLSAFRNYQKVQSQVEMASIDLESIKNNIIIKTVEAYLNVLETQDNLKSYEISKKYLEDQLAIVDKKVKLGNANSLELDQARANYENIKYQGIVLNNLYNTQKQQLSHITNHNIDSVNPLTKDVTSIDIGEDTVDQWMDLARVSNHDIIKNTIQIEVANRDIQIAQSGYYPNVEAFASFSLNNTDALERQDVTMGLAFNMNLFNGGADKQASKQAQHTKKSAEFMLKELENNIFAAINTYYLNVYSGVSEVKALELGVYSAEKSLDKAVKSYDLGLVSNIDVLVANENYFNLQKDLSKAKYRFLLSILTLKSTAGILKVEDISDINAMFQ